MSLEEKLEARPTQYQDTVRKWPAAIVRHQKYAAKSSTTPGHNSNSSSTHTQ